MKLEVKLNDCIVYEKPNVKWEDVAELEKVKKALKEAFIFPKKFKEKINHGKEFYYMEPLEQQNVFWQK